MELPGDTAPRSFRLLDTPAFVAFGLIAGFFDAYLLRALGLSFAINGGDATLIVGTYFGVSFALLGWLLGTLLRSRERERLAASLLREQVELLDITRQRLAQADKLASLGQLAAAIAHEVRNPLGVIRSAAQSATEAGDEHERQRAAQFIVSEADRLNAVVGSVLAFAKPLQVQRRPAVVNDVIERAIALVRGDLAAKQLRLRPQTQPVMPPLEADPDLLTQALLGLLNNAIQASGSGGAIDVVARAEGDAVCIDVSDTGPGIPDDLRSRVFEPFFTTRSQGTGLGLAIVRQIVEAHRGSVALRKAESGGACFTMRLPLAAPA